MWAPLGRKKQLPGLTSLKKNSSWSCAKTFTHGIYDQKNTSLTIYFFNCACPNLDFILLSRCVCGPSSSPPPVPSPTPPCVSLLERPRLKDASNLTTLSDWPGSRWKAGMLQIQSEERLGRKGREKIMSDQRGDKRERESEGQPEEESVTSDGRQCVYKCREQETGL